MKFTLIDLAVEASVATLTLNRPDKRNAMSDEMRTEFIAALEQVAADKDIRALVLTGAGKGFCAGGDLPFFAGQGDALRDTVDRMLNDAHRFLELLRATNRLVLASVHGAAAGAGLSLVVACDFCIAASDAVFVPAYTRLGVSPDLGGTANLVRAIGVRAAMRVHFLEERMSAAQAESLGIVSRIVEVSALTDSTLKLAHELATLPQEAAESTKALLRQASQTALPQQLVAELASFQACVHRPALQAALQRFTKK
jgi:enoyl-CoA hydratase/carnithine racemase